MALKDWKKMTSGIDHYKIKDGIGEVWMDIESKTERTKATAVHGPNAHKYKTVYKYIAYHHYLGDGGHPDVSIFATKPKAHEHIMKHMKNKDY